MGGGEKGHRGRGEDEASLAAAGPDEGKGAIDVVGRLGVEGDVRRACCIAETGV